MSHAAFRPDADLFPQAAAGDGEASLVVVERHASAVWAAARRVTGVDDAATLATVVVFARLLTGELPGATGPVALTEALPDVIGGLPTIIPRPRRGRKMAPNAPSVAALTEAIATRLPDDRRAALAAARRGEGRAAAEPEAAPALAAPVRTLPAIDALGPLTGPDLIAAGALPDPDALVRARRSRGRRLDRYMERRPAARWLVPLAIVATVLALWVGRVTPPTTPVAPDRLPSAWPTLRPRPTQPVAQIEPSPTIVAQAIIIVTPTREPTPTPEPPTSTVPATEAPAAPTVAPTEAPVPPTPVPSQPPIAVVPPQSAPRAPLPTTAPPVPTAAPPTATPPRPSPSPTTAETASASPSARPSAAPSPSPSPTTAQLALTTQSLGFGVEVGPRALVFTNPGNDPLTWRVVADSTWMDLTQASGTLAPGRAQAVGITVTRADLPTGAYNGAVQVLTNGGDGLVPVTMTISPSNTTVSAYAEPETPIGALGCAAPNTYEVSAEIAGNQPPKRAVVYFAINGGAQQTKDLAAQGRRYTATLGPFTEPGNVIYSLVITEADGNVVRSAPYTLVVSDCASRVRTVPVTVPTTQPFALVGGGHNLYTFAVTKPGSLVVTLAWQGEATRLSTLLFSPSLPTQPFEQRTGVGSLTFSFPVTEADIAAGGTWALHLINYEQGQATGRLELAFVPEGQPVPSPSPSASPSPSPSPPPSPRVTPGPSVAPSPSATPAPTRTPTVAPSPTATPTPRPAPSQAPQPSNAPGAAPSIAPKAGTPGR